ncbi:MAG: aminotransferase class V-fold PLP-dependent enzyme [Firmicutes bacterium]|nr:aminotransferase class V-fold PLP-dependent enzyme [Bacillota bacterium]
MKTVYTAYDVEQAKLAGKDSILIDEDSIITTVAQETADRLGIVFIKKDRKNAKDPFYRDKSDAAYAKAITEDDAIRWKEEFPILKDIIHVANCSQGPQAKRVRKAIETYLDNWLTVGMDWEYWVGETIKAKEEFAKLINAHPSEIAISTSVSEATASIASSLNVNSPKKKIVTTEAEFPTVAHVWLAHQKYGFKVDFIPLKNGEILEEDYEKIVDEDTVITSVTHVYYQNGFKQDIKKIADIVHKNGSLILVDAYQSVGTVHIDVKEMDIDILTSGNLKYLLGIPGIAFTYVKKDIIPWLKPAVTGWFGQENPFAFHVRYLDFAGDARRFDTGTPPVLASFAAKAGMEIINQVGPKFIQDRIDILSEYTIKGALERGLEVVSPIDVSKKGATTAVKVPDPHDVELQLKKRNIIASARGDVIRIAPHFFTTKSDLDVVLDQLKDIMKK